MLFLQGIAISLQKQNLAEYLFTTITKMKKNPSLKLEEVLVQVIGNDQVSDGITNFHCMFKKPARKGSYLRLTEWDVDLKNYQLIINGYQLLGGEGYNVRAGKPWDTEKLRYLNNSKLASSDYVILHSPDRNIETVRLPEIGGQYRIDSEENNKKQSQNQFQQSRKNSQQGNQAAGKPILRTATPLTSETTILKPNKIRPSDSPGKSWQTEIKKNPPNSTTSLPEKEDQMGLKFEMKDIKKLLDKS